jgi:hypothetical protein
MVACAAPVLHRHTCGGCLEDAALHSLFSAHHAVYLYVQAPPTAPPRTCCYITCHICVITYLNFVARYEEDPERRERFYYTMLGGGGSPPESACPEVARLVVQQHFNCPSVWCILPLQVTGWSCGCVLCVCACVPAWMCSRAATAPAYGASCCCREWAGLVAVLCACVPAWLCNSTSTAPAYGASYHCR